MRLRIFLVASVAAIALLSSVPVNSARSLLDVLNGDDSSQPPMETMPIYNPLDPVKLVTGEGAAQGQMSYHGGPIQHIPAAYICYWHWTGDTYGEKTYLQNFLSGTGGSSWEGVETQYYGPSGTYITNPSGVLKGTWDDATSIPSHPTQSQLASAAGRCSSHFGYNKDADYFIATPSGHSMNGFGTQWCAWHSYATGNIAYTNMPYIHDAGASCGQNFVNSGSAGTLDGVSIVGGHEWMETNTDPLLNAWYDGSGAENGDLCAWISPGSPGGSHNLVLGTGTFAVQTTWSNSPSGCLG